MKIDVVVPEVGESITSGFLASWLKSDGDTITEGDDLFELETEKTTLVVPSTSSGVLNILVQAESEIQIGQVVAEVDQDAVVAQESTQPSDTAPAAVPQQAKSEAEKSLSPAVKRVVAEHDLDASKLPATGPKGNIIKEDVLRAVETQAKPSQPRSASGPRSTAETC